jgi:hypothetical protein
MNIFIEITQWIIVTILIFILIKKYHITLMIEMYNLMQKFKKYIKSKNENKKRKVVNAEYKVEKDEELEWR